MTRTEITSTVKGNPVGLLLGAAAGFIAAKKLGKFEKNWQLGLSAIAGGVLGAMAQKKFGAKKVVLTKETVTTESPSK